MALNYIVIHGRLTHDPEWKQTQSGVSVCNFTVAVDRPHTKAGEDKQTDFFSVTCWRGLADMVSKYFSKGKEIVVSGAMQSRKWQDKEGNNRISWEIQADSVDFCGSKSADPGSADSRYSSANHSETHFEELADDGELPF